MQRNGAKKTVKGLPGIVEEMSGNCIAMRVRLLSRVLSSLYDRRVASLGIKASQGAMLVAIAKSGPLPQKLLGERLSMEKSTVSRNLKRMLAKGWIKALDGEDGRLQAVDLTPEGGKLLVEIHRKWREAQKEAEELLGEESVRSVKRITSSCLGV